jgi:uracil phosphoribosyltransferase
METFIFNHPLLSDKLTRLRDRRTGPHEFRQLVEQVTVLMLYEAARHLPRTLRRVETPLSPATCQVLAGDAPVLVPVLRAGLAMLAPLQAQLPESPVGHLGLERDHGTLQPRVYLSKLPEKLAGRPTWLLDPMLATGGSAGAALSAVKASGADNLSLLSIIAAPEGISRLRREHPDVRLFVGAVDEKLNDCGYIVPGLGDAGDRLYGTS